VGLSILGPNMGPKNRAFQYGAFLTPLVLYNLQAQKSYVYVILVMY
jgi:hypothetical protein